MIDGMSRLLIAPAAIACFGLVVPGDAARAQVNAGAIELAPHRAVYDLKLASSSGKRSLEAVRGRILYDFAGSTCEGYSLQFRQVTELDSGEGKSVTSDLRMTNWEEGAGKSFRFMTQNFLDGKPSDGADGRAEEGAAGVSVELAKPEKKRIALGAVVFPSEHMRRIIAAARTGKTLVEVAVYDGSETGEKVYNTLTVIGREIAPGERPPTDAAAGKQELAAMKRWPMTVSYFERGKAAAGGEQTPAYAITFEVYENGVSRALKLDYGDFTLTGEMTTLELGAAKPCR
jgi:envelope integrity protein B